MELSRIVVYGPMHKDTRKTAESMGVRPDNIITYDHIPGFNNDEV